MIFQTPPSPPPVPALPASTPWWAVVLVIVAPIVGTIIVQILAHRRKTASLVRAQKDISVNTAAIDELRATAAALQDHSVEARDDPKLVARIQVLELRVDRVEADLKAETRKREEDAAADARAAMALTREVAKITGTVDALQEQKNGSRSRRG